MVKDENGTVSSNRQRGQHFTFNNNEMNVEINNDLT